VPEAEPIVRLFNNLLNLGLTVGATAAAFWLMWGAFIYMGAGGNPRQMETGKSAMFNALVGFAIVLAARSLAGLIQRAVTGG
jgi:hypothetical protein